MLNKLSVLASSKSRSFGATIALIATFLYCYLILISVPLIDDEIDWFSVISEGLLAVLAGVGLFITVRIEESQKVNLLVGWGLGLLFMAFSSDTLDEFCEVPALASIIVEGGFQDIGFILLILGIRHWIIEKEQTAKNLEILATTDMLTGVKNRHHFLELIEHDVANIKRTKGNFSVLLIDIDHFKNFNDQFGHHKGDEVLKAFAKTISSNLRQGDIFCRYGGEEFAIALLNTDLDNAVAVAENLRALVKDICVPQIDAISASFGVAQYDTSESVDALIHRADEALYTAKSEGRDRVICSDVQHSHNKKICA